MNRMGIVLASTVACGGMASMARADNPLFTDQFSADPTARVFKDQLYVYPSHDIRGADIPGRPDWFVMEDYHSFSSKNGINWTDHGVIVTQKKVDWVDGNSYSMWAPDCVERDGKYYFFFPANMKRELGGRGSRIGVAVSDDPGGPWTPREKPIEGIGGIDPGILIDKDGQAYIFAAGGRISVAKLNADFTATEGQTQVIANLPTQGLIEGPFPFMRNGKYYLTYPHAANGTERLEYAMADSPMGPYTVKGVIMDESPTGCWTNHQSVVQYQGKWILFYHDRDLSPNFDKARSIRADYLEFNDDGTIKKVERTVRGIGVADATQRIQIDRYSALSDKGAAVAYNDPAYTFMGWKVTLSEPGAYARYDRVNFGDGVKSFTVRGKAPKGGTVELRLDKPDGPVVGKAQFRNNGENADVGANLDAPITGQHDLIVTLSGEGEVGVDWVQFGTTERQQPPQRGPGGFGGGGPGAGPGAGTRPTQAPAPQQ